MAGFADDFRDNAQAVWESELPLPKKREIVARIVHQVELLRDFSSGSFSRHEVPLLTPQEREKLEIVYREMHTLLFRIDSSIRDL